MKKAWIKYIACVVLIIMISLLYAYFVLPERSDHIDYKALEEDIKLMDRLTAALQKIMDDIDDSLEWNSRTKQEPLTWWTELEEE